ncbi:hypothetical protein T440DRAFT_549982 [Plenodomus tracheiphilus IPT5]|uniref:CPAF-like PDZ domain-containing protein n=1 Tax=Plenodomus tracheiphilus IPT5 TaxID=1408161 RepID=A0A6A7BQI8_9PLEO|nr:hypothetical protein T440DRAFT_549982 [Plenodomus tracheiphilus IPT5]
MARLFGTVAGLSLASVALASPLTPHLYSHHNASSPCAQVSAAAATQTAAVPTVPAQLAYECIQSVPFNQSAALALVDSMVPYIRWHSTTAWLKDPPAEYVEKVQDPVDVWGGLDNIREKVSAGDYKNEFEFGFELYLLLQSTHDGHLVFVPDVVGTVFNYARPVPLISVSSDGQELPKPYVYSDVLAELLGNASFVPSAVSKIDGQDAKTFLEHWSQYGSLQDRDALYNNVFYQLATVALGSVGSGIGTFAGSGRGKWIFPGATTELEFENGTTCVYDNFAKVLIPFKGITDGESLYQIWFTGNQPTKAGTNSSGTATPTPSASASATPVPPIPAPGYPPPIVREAHNLIGGYYLGDDMVDVAVLSVPSFVGNDDQEQFQATAVQFLAAAKAAGKKKLIIDVQTNGGGTILVGYDLYKLLFPSLIDHAAADRFRAFETTDIIGQEFSNFSSQYPRIEVTEKQNETLYNATGIIYTVFNYATNLDVNSENFTSWDDMYGPVHEKGDNFTNLFRWNLADPLIVEQGGINIHGYGPLSNYTTTPFAAEDIVVVSDGYCASTCAIFSELMRQRAGVKYISLGGRPRAGITQAVGGVKGANSLPWDYIQQLAQAPVISTNSSIEQSQQLNSTQLNEYWSDIPFQRSTNGSSITINFRDGIRDGDESHTPLQFLYEPSDCRILLTKAMTVDITAIWEAVAETAWGGKSHCIAGSIGGNGTTGYKKRDLTLEDRALGQRMREWRSELRVDDYPLDLRPDATERSVLANGMMWI